MPPDLYDISHHNTISDWSAVDPVPIVHKVNEGRQLDRKVMERLPVIADRTEIFGGYTVLIVSTSTIREQIERYASIIGLWWRDGCFTQLDVEPWTGYPRAVNCDEVEEAQDRHDDIFGPGRCTVYINPNQMPETFRQWRSANPDRPLWLPNYSRGGTAAAERLGATVHQYTSKYPAPGFTSGIDANRVLNWDTLRAVCNLDQAPIPRPMPPQPVEEDDMPQILIHDTVLEAVFTLDGMPVSQESMDCLVLSGALVIDQDHPQWREAMLHRNGAVAGFSYGARTASRP